MKVTITITADCWLQAVTLMNKVIVWILKADYTDSSITKTGGVKYTEKTTYGKFKIDIDPES
jgi:hypothetical protein